MGSQSRHQQGDKHPEAGAGTSPMPRAMALRVSIFISIAEGISIFLRDAISSDLIQQPGHFLIGISRTQRFDGQISPVAGFFDEAE